jgi:hypothetical protein
MNIYQKLVEVRKSVKSFEKSASGYNFKYVPGVQILTEIKSTMDSQGIILEHHLTETTVTHLEKTWFVSSKMKMVWVNSEKPEDKIEIDWFCTGEQKDPSQALGSALTYSERYFLLKFFGIPTDEDDPDGKPPVTPPKPPYKPPVTPPVKPVATTATKPVDPDLKLKNELVKKHNGNTSEAEKEYIQIVRDRNKVEELDAETEEYFKEKFELEGAKV